MKFGSVKEYFYKLNTIGFQLMMLPLILFIIFYSRSIIKLPEMTLFAKGITGPLLLMMGVVSMIVLTAVQIVVKKKANTIAKELGLGIKLERLGRVLKNKMVALSVLILLMPLMLMLTDESDFSIGFGILALWYFLQWPTPGRVCRLLKLKGDEREMVITRGDAFR
jgi:hypothetical protein